MPGGDMDSDSDCASVDSGLETGNSNLEASYNLDMDNNSFDMDNGTYNMDNSVYNIETSFKQLEDSFTSLENSYSPDLTQEDTEDNIYENASVLKSTHLVKSVVPAMEKYQFGQAKEAAQSVVFPEAEDIFKDPPRIGLSKHEGTAWGVRGSNIQQQAIVRGANPTEDKIAMEIRELKEREEELKKFRENLKTSGKSGAVSASVMRGSVSTSVIPDAAAEEADKKIDFDEKRKKLSNSDRFNPNNYRPQIVPARPRIMEEFLASGGKVTAFSPPDPFKMFGQSTSTVQLRKPQVHKTMPKVSPPVGATRPPSCNVVDKIQAELAESIKREEELRQARRAMFRSQPDLSRIIEPEMEEQKDEVEEIQSPAVDEEEQEDPPSFMLMRGKSALISVWENRIQSAERNT